MWYGGTPTLSLGNFGSGEILEGKVVTNVIECLPRLNDLVLMMDLRRGYGRRLHFESHSLATLDVSQLPKSAFVSCKCPKNWKSSSAKGGILLMGPYQESLRMSIKN
jgi:hypothetical protein